MREEEFFKLAEEISERFENLPRFFPRNPLFIRLNL